MMPTQTNKPLTADSAFYSASYSTRHHSAKTLSGVELMASLIYLAGMPTTAEASEENGDRDQTEAQQDQKTGLAHTLPPIYKISNWLGKPVNNESGEQIGTIRDMIMDDYGRFRYVIMESEQVADEYKGDRIAVPMNHFQYPDNDGGGSEQASLPFDENRDMVYLPDAKDQLFEKLDTNDDAAITEKEAKARAVRAHRQL